MFQFIGNITLAKGAAAMEDLVEVGEYDSIVEADLAKGKLEAYGIEAILVNKGLAQIYPGGTYAFGGIRLLVKARDAETASEVLLPEES